MSRPRFSIDMPATFLDRDVTIRVARSGSRWILEAEDRNGQLFDLCFPNYTGTVNFTTKSGAVEFFAREGGLIGDRYFTGDLRA